MFTASQPKHDTLRTLVIKARNPRNPCTSGPYHFEIVAIPAALGGESRPYLNVKYFGGESPLTSGGHLRPEDHKLFFPSLKATHIAMERLHDIACDNGLPAIAHMHQRSLGEAAKWRGRPNRPWDYKLMDPEKKRAMARRRAARFAKAARLGRLSYG